MHKYARKACIEPTELIMSFHWTDPEECGHEYEDGYCLICGDEQDVGSAIDDAMDALEDRT